MFIGGGTPGGGGLQMCLQLVIRAIVNYILSKE